MTNDEAQNNDEARITDWHPERSETQSKDPAELLIGFATGFLDFARNDGQLIPHLSFGLRSAFAIRISSFSPHLPVLHEVSWNFLEKT